MRNFLNNANKGVIVGIMAVLLGGVLIGGIIRLKSASANTNAPTPEGQVQGDLTQASPTDAPTDTPFPTDTPAPTDTPTNSPTTSPTPTATPINCGNGSVSTNNPDPGQSNISGGTVPADGSTPLTFTLTLKDSSGNPVQGANVSISASNVSFNQAYGTNVTSNCGEVTFNAVSSTASTYSVNVSGNFGNSGSSFNSITPSGNITFSTYTTPTPIDTPTPTPAPTPTSTNSPSPSPTPTPTG